MKNNLLVADVNEHGEVEAVWRWAEGMRHPSLVRHAQEIAHLVDSAPVSGASRDGLHRWYRRRRSAEKDAAVAVG